MGADRRRPSAARLVAGDTGGARSDRTRSRGSRAVLSTAGGVATLDRAGRNALKSVAIGLNAKRQDLFEVALELESLDGADGGVAHAAARHPGCDKVFHYASGLGHYLGRLESRVAATLDNFAGLVDRVADRLVADGRVDAEEFYDISA